MIRALWIGLAALALAGAATTTAGAESRLFTDEAPLRLVITGPLPALVKAAPTATDPFPASLSVQDGAAPAQTMAIQLRARGHSRRTDGYCSFPPIWLVFDKAAAHDTVFHGQHKLKLVTYCSKGADYEQRIVLEYLAYRIYNLITPISFRVRAAEVTYRTSDADAGLTRFGYLIEDADDVADRNDRAVLSAQPHDVSPAQLDPHAAARASLFEFLIGNLDWEFLTSAAGVDCCHNSRLIAAPAATPARASAVAPLPYDFDWSGLVDAPYAGPPPGIPVDVLTERYYRGYCVSSGEIASVADEYRAHRAEVMGLVASEPHLTASFRGKATHFLEGFYAVLDDPGKLQRQVVGHCR